MVGRGVWEFCIVLECEGVGKCLCGLWFFDLKVLCRWDLGCLEFYFGLWWRFSC